MISHVIIDRMGQSVDGLMYQEDEVVLEEKERGRGGGNRTRRKRKRKRKNGEKEKRRRRRRRRRHTWAVMTIAKRFAFS